MPSYAPSHTYNEQAARGDYGAREQLAQLYQSPQTTGRLATLYGGQILESSGQEERIRAELQYLRDMLADVNPSMTPILAQLIKNEIAKNEYDLARLGESAGASSMMVAQQQNADIGAQSGLLDMLETTGMLSASYPTVPFKDTSSSLSAVGTEGVADWRTPQMPSYMSGWMTPLGARPIGAQTQMGPTERSALWESIAMQKAGNVTNLQDYLTNVQPFIQMYGEQHENMSQRLQPRERQRTALWRAPRQ